MKNLFFACLAVLGMCFATEANAQQIDIWNSTNCTYMIKMSTGGCMGFPTSSIHTLAPGGHLPVPITARIDQMEVAGIGTSAGTAAFLNVCSMPAGGGVWVGISGTPNLTCNTVDVDAFLWQPVPGLYVMELTH